MASEALIHADAAANDAAALQVGAGQDVAGAPAMVVVAFAIK
jgi:hypothetical protein